MLMRGWLAPDGRVSEIFERAACNSEEREGMSFAADGADAEAETSMLDLERMAANGSASQAEILAALEALEPPDLLRLRSYARYRVRGLGWCARGRSHEDLLSEAFTATLAGTRRWNKSAVDFVGHLCGVMRSVSSHWAETKEARALEPADGAFVDHVEASAPDAERELAARQEVERIVRHFEEDPLVLAIIDGFRKGLKGPEVQANLGIDQTEFETAVRRLRRGVEKLARAEEDRDG